MKIALLSLIAFACLLPVTGLAHMEHPAKELLPYYAIQECASKLELESPRARKPFLDCTLPHFAKEVDSRISERLAFWFASQPIIDHVRICSPAESKFSGDFAHSDKIGCFEILVDGSVKTGYIFLRNNKDKWSILDIKY
jgi:hypothetical protein